MIWLFIFFEKQLRYAIGYFLPALPAAMKNGVRLIRFSLVGPVQLG